MNSHLNFPKTSSALSLFSYVFILWTSFRCVCFPWSSFPGICNLVMAVILRSKRPLKSKNYQDFFHCLQWLYRMTYCHQSCRKILPFANKCLKGSFPSLFSFMNDAYWKKIYPSLPLFLWPIMDLKEAEQVFLLSCFVWTWEASIWRVSCCFQREQRQCSQHMPHLYLRDSWNTSQPWQVAPLQPGRSVWLKCLEK